MLPAEFFRSLVYYDSNYMTKYGADESFDHKRSDWHESVDFPPTAKQSKASFYESYMPKQDSYERAGIPSSFSTFVN